MRVAFVYSAITGSLVDVISRIARIDDQTGLRVLLATVLHFMEDGENISIVEAHSHPIIIGERNSSHVAML